VKVLIADDDDNTRFLLELYCRTEEFTPVFVMNGRAAIERFQEGDIDAVVTDVLMPDISGEVVLDEVKRIQPEVPVLLMTAEPTVGDAVRLLKRGADDYLTKPVPHEVFSHRLRVLLESTRLRREVQDARSRVGETTVIGHTAVLESLLRRLPMTAQADATVLITGESGTGKEVFARRVHELSRRAQKPFVAVNCGALPDDLLESELFGYRRGAFTSAHKDTQGLVEEAAGGTLFLDEIGEISPHIQVKFLRFLQLKEFKPLGSPKSQTANVRIVAATNRDLRLLVASGRFREDLFYRLNIIPLHVPPLRERRADIPLLATHFMNHYRRVYEKPGRVFSPEVLAQMVAYDWPGNVRELENRVQQLVVLSDTDLIRNITFESVDPLPAKLMSTFRDEKKRLVDGFEKTYTRHMLERTAGNLSEAARLAGLDRKSFFNLAKRTGVHVNDDGRR
jgi:DNA-binding NtrC family response regulator